MKAFSPGVAGPVSVQHSNGLVCAPQYPGSFGPGGLADAVAVSELPARTNPPVKRGDDTASRDDHVNPPANLLCEPVLMGGYVIEGFADADPKNAGEAHPFRDPSNFAHI